MKENNEVNMRVKNTRIYRGSKRINVPKYRSEVRRKENGIKEMKSENTKEK
jgi:hypothetical protein